MAIKSNIGGIRIATINDLEELKESISSGDSNVSFLIGEDGSTTLRIENSDGSVDELIIANTQEIDAEIDALQTQIAELTQREDSDTVYDDTEIRGLITELQNREDKDTTYTAGTNIAISEDNVISTTLEVDGEAIAYDDTELVNRVAALEERVDSDTIYDDTQIVERIEALENEVDLDTVYDDTQLTERIIALEERIDNDTIYDDTELVGRVVELENRPDNDTTYTAGSNIRINEQNVISAIIPTQEEGISYDDEPVWEALGTKQDTLTAGDNITINDNVIASTDTIYDDTELRGLVEEISNRVDNDTIYDDTEVRALITELQERVDNDTIYDDAEVRALISNLQTEIDNLDNYDDTEVRGLISQLQTTVDSWTDTVYDDTEIQDSVNTLSNNLSDVEQSVRDIDNTVGQPSGIATLDENGHVPSAQLPSYVDDVLEFETLESLPKPGESGKIYVTTSDNKTYRWGGTEYAEISASLALGTTDSTAYRGDYGNIAYQHSQATGNAHNLTAGDIGAATIEQLAELQTSQSEISGVIFITETEYNNMVSNGTLGNDTYIVYRPTT